MTKVEMTAMDSFHASAATPADLVAGGKFTINADEGAALEKSGLAKPAKAVGVAVSKAQTEPAAVPMARKPTPAKTRKA